MKLRTRRGPNCDEARDKEAIVIVKVSEATVIIDPAIVASTVLAPSALPAVDKGPEPKPVQSISLSRASVNAERTIDPRVISAGMNQKVSRSAPNLPKNLLTIGKGYRGKRHETVNAGKF